MNFSVLSSYIMSCRVNISWVKIGFPLKSFNWKTKPIQRELYTARLDFWFNKFRILSWSFLVNPVSYLPAKLRPSMHVGIKVVLPFGKLSHGFLAPEPLFGMILQFQLLWQFTPFVVDYGKGASLLRMDIGRGLLAELWARCKAAGHPQSLAHKAVQKAAHFWSEINGGILNFREEPNI